MNTNNINEEMTINELSPIWLNFKKNSIKQSTYDDYDNMINYYIIPSFGSLQMCNLKIQIIQAEIDKWAKSGFSLNTLKLIFSVLKQLYEWFNSVSQTQILINFKLLQLPLVPDHFIEIFTQDEQYRIVKYLFQNPKRINLGIAFGLFSGLRIGEACAIKWGDIDMKNSTFNVVGTVQRISTDDKDAFSASKTKLHISTPKTRKSIRTVPMMSSLKVLLMQIEPEDVERNADCYITSGKKVPTDPKYLRNVYKKMLNRLDIRYLKFHSLRHTFATYARKSGMPIEYLSKLLGHKSVQTTIDIYLHPRIDELRKAMLDFENNWF